jgi:hypothetical protein
VDTFIDFLCPFCRQFELSSSPPLAGLVTELILRAVEAASHAEPDTA